MKNPRTIRILRIILAAIIMFGIGFASATGLAWAKRENIQRSADAFIVDMTKGDTDKAYGRLSDSAKSRQTKDDVSKALYGMKADKPKLTNQHLYTSSERSIYKLTIENLPETVAGRTDANVTIELVPVRFGWKVDSVSIE